MNRLVIFGAGQIAEVVRHYLENDSPWRVSAFTVDGACATDTALGGIPIVPFEEVARSFPPAEYRIFVAVSYQKVNRLRAEKLAAAEALGYSAIHYVSSKASVWRDLEVGPNTFIFEDNTIQPFVRVGRNVIIWSGNHVGHHATIGDHVFIASHAVISGSVRVGDFSFIGVNATIRDNVSIAPSCVIGAGALILHDTKQGEVYMGSGSEPSKVPSHRLRGI